MVAKEKESLDSPDQSNELMERDLNRNTTF